MPKDFSVIITSYNRKQFLTSLIDSLLIYTKNYDSEIIVVKNFLDERIDSYLDSLPVINIYSKDTTLGGKLKDGISRSSGNIIFFVEDDDLFHPDKIPRVLNTFGNRASISRIDFYHNAALTFSDQIPNKIEVKNEVDVFKPSNNSRSLLNTLYHKHKAGFNVSSIVLDRNFAVESSDLLGKVKLTADTFLFFYAWEKRRNIAIDKNTLTFYRRVQQSKDTVNLEVFKMQLEDAELFEKVFTDKIIMENIQKMKVYRELLYKIMSGEKSGLSYVWRIAKDLQWIKWDWFMFLLSVINSASNKLARKIYLRMLRSNSMFS
ncbi:glycosyltransferase family 2 protein [Sulfolobus acidocaldarius]|uniref:Glycosyl transferase n=4 Tax=Sulfolobus acidocaldarius TaxID=2285 RepID=Q4J7L3_SULAC|nr:glycosyltransferase family 2 protein [Sulfolobus acidocaldarius]AAY81218.1 glycosyl transferase [Sulfolobus acidocaldarius DSM 639]AGE71838.1 glycosyl transferase [Sulfolobus acidocaldarius N8]AGE74110.1 glycosyl transferase [Sulfolobus acidocaldarius Ron12/I]ALU29973.1 glycosyl transferase [Sulfolobus acidocaldarius]WCM35715.1 glycosyltransferase [Sulfolobus acidocaldarius DSM 639]